MPDSSQPSNDDALRARWTREVRTRLSSLRLSPTREAEIVQELTQHLDEHFRDLIAGGTSPEEAERLTLAEFREGNVLARHMAPLRQAQTPPPVTLGANRARLARALLSESVLLALGGGVLGLALAEGALGLLRWLSPAYLPRLDEIDIDATVLLFAFAISPIPKRSRRSSSRYPRASSAIRNRPPVLTRASRNAWPRSQASPPSACRPRSPWTARTMATT